MLVLDNNNPIFLRLSFSNRSLVVDRVDLRRAMGAKPDRWEVSRAACGGGTCRRADAAGHGH